jgi:hypothetical protein
MDEKTKLQNALLKIYNNTIDAEVGHLYQKILLNVKDKQEEIKGIYSYIQTLESIK